MAENYDLKTTARPFPRVRKTSQLLQTVQPDSYVDDSQGTLIIAVCTDETI